MKKNKNNSDFQALRKNKNFIKISKITMITNFFQFRDNQLKRLKKFHQKTLKKKQTKKNYKTLILNKRHIIEYFKLNIREFSKIFCWLVH